MYAHKPEMALGPRHTQRVLATRMLPETRLAQAHSTTLQSMLPLLLTRRLSIASPPGCATKASSSLPNTATTQMLMLLLPPQSPRACHTPGLALRILPFLSTRNIGVQEFQAFGPLLSVNGMSSRATYKRFVAVAAPPA